MVMHIMVPYIGRNGDVYGSGRDQGLGILKNPMERSVPHDMEAWKASLYTVCRDDCHYYWVAVKELKLSYHNGSI